MDSWKIDLHASKEICNCRQNFIRENLQMIYNQADEMDLKLKRL